MTRLAPAVACALVFAACDSGDATPERTDAAPDAATPDAALIDAALAPDAAIEAWPCRAGWQTASDGITCEPDPDAPCPAGACDWPCVEGWSRGEAGCAPPPLPTCPAGQFAYPGGCSAPWPCPEHWSPVEGMGCAPARDACPPGKRPDWDGTCDALGLVDCPVRAPPDGAIHVDAEAPEGGDGNAARPFRALSDALAHAQPGAVVVLAAGRYSAPEISGVELEGRCADVVTVTAPVLDNETVLRGVTLDAAEAAPALPPGAHVEMTEVRLMGDSAGLVVTAEANLVAQALQVAGAGPGVQVAAGAAFDCERCLFEGAPGVSIMARGSVTLSRSTIRSRGRSAITGLEGSTVTLEDVRVVEAWRAVDLSGSTLRGERLFVEGGKDGVAGNRRSDIELTDFATVNNGGRDLNVLQSC